MTSNKEIYHEALDLLYRPQKVDVARAAGLVAGLHEQDTTPTLSSTNFCAATHGYAREIEFQQSTALSGLQKAISTYVAHKQFDMARVYGVGYGLEQDFITPYDARKTLMGIVQDLPLSLRRGRIRYALSHIAKNGIQRAADVQVSRQFAKAANIAHAVHIVNPFEHWTSRKLEEKLNKDPEWSSDI